MHRASSQTFLVSATLPLYLVSQTLSAASAAAPAEPPGTDTIVLVDVSGSMAGDLPELRKHLKNALPTMVREGDTFSLIYFSSRGQCGTLLEGSSFSDLRDVPRLHAAIDRLRPIGLTGFEEPLILAGKLAEKLRACKQTNPLRHVVFMSDGYHNDPMSRGIPMREAVLGAVLEATRDGRAQQLTTVGYGYCCDQGLLQDMAAAAPCGGQFLFAADFARWGAVLEAACARRPEGAPRRRVVLDRLPFGAVFSHDKGDLTQYACTGGEVLVPETVETIWYLSETPLDGVNLQDRARQEAGARAPDGPRVAFDSVTAAYLAMGLQAQRSNRKTVRALATAIGDARLITAAGACFGPQRYNAFADACFEAARSGYRTGPSSRFVEGFDPSRAVAPDAFTVLDALRALDAGDNRIHVDHPAFAYTPITRRRVAAAALVSEADAKRAAEIAATVTAGAEADVLDAAIEALRALKEQKGAALPWSYVGAPEGYSIDGLVYGSEEANVSIRVKRRIAVDLTGALAELPTELRARVPASYTAERYNSFTVVTGRVLNLAQIPASLDDKTWALFRQHGLVRGPHTTEPVVVDLAALPIVNDDMVTSLSARVTATDAYDLEVVKALIKVYADLQKLVAPPKIGALAAWAADKGFEGFDAVAVTDWLQKLGFSDRGYDPKSASAPATDKRRSWLLDVAIPGLSSLPSVEKVRAKMAAIAAWQAAPKGKEPKFTTAEALMFPAIQQVDGFLAQEGLTAAKLDPDALDAEVRNRILAYCAAKIGPLDADRRRILFAQSRAAIIAICGGEWFQDMEPGAETVEVPLDGVKTTVRIGIRDVEIAI